MSADLKPACAAILAVASAFLIQHGLLESAAPTAGQVAIEPAGVSDLYPGAPGNVYVALANDSPQPATVTAIHAESVVSSDPVRCPTRFVQLATSIAQAPIIVPPHTHSPVITLSNAITMNTDAPDGCQGVTFTVSFRLETA